MTRMTGGEFMAETFKAYGVSTVFFVPAIAKRALMEMEKRGIRRVLCHSEKAAAYMADGYARAARRPGIAMAQSVGAANLAAGLQDAWLARSPVIAITGRWPHIRRYRHAYQEIDHWPLYEPVTKFNAYVDTVGDLPHLLRQAFREATSGAPGPVHLGLTGLTAELVVDAEAELDVIIEDRFAQIPPFRPEPDAAQVRRAVELLGRSQRPVLIAGGGVTASGARAEMVRLAEMLSIPVATSLNAKGTIREDHPLALGIPGTYSRWCANQIVSEADLVLFVGSHTGGQVTHFWQVPRPGSAVIQIDIDAAELGRNYPVEVALHGDAKVTLQRLIESLAMGEPGRPGKARRAWAERAGQLVSQWREELEPHFQSDAVPIRPERICAELARQLPTDALLVSDTGHSGIWTGTMVDLTQPEQRYLRCSGSLGWGLPAALGAKCAAPDRPVICFTGDGGFWYHMSELETAVRCGINTVTVINNNHSLNQDRSGVDRVYAGQPGNSAEIWVFQELDLARVAESMGCVGIRVERPGHIQSALEQALAADRPAVVDVASDIEIAAPLPIVPD
jgi:acetolactate synthase-1/2/3 large subunit